MRASSCCTRIHILGALLVLRYAPETKGFTLEEIDAQLSGGAAAVPHAGAAAPAAVAGGAGS